MVKRGHFLEIPDVLCVLQCYIHTYYLVPHHAKSCHIISKVLVDGLPPVAQVDGLPPVAHCVCVCVCVCVCGVCGVCGVVCVCVCVLVCADVY